MKWFDKDGDDDEFRALLMQYCADSVAGQIISLGKQYRPIQLLEYQTDVRSSLLRPYIADTSALPTLELGFMPVVTTMGVPSNSRKTFRQK